MLTKSALFPFPLFFKYYDIVYHLFLFIHNLKSQFHLHRDLLPPLDHVQKKLCSPYPAGLIAEMHGRDTPGNRF